MARGPGLGVLLWTRLLRPVWKSSLAELAQAISLELDARRPRAAAAACAPRRRPRRRARIHAPSSVARSTPAASRWRRARRASSAAPSSARSAARFACRSRSSSSSRAAAAAPCAARPKHVRRVRPGPHRSSARFSGRRSLRLRRSAHPCECRRRLRRPHRPRRSSACGLLVERCSNERRRRCVQERRRLCAVRGERPAVAVRGQRSSWYAARCSLRRLLCMRGGGSLEGGLLCSLFDTGRRTTHLCSVELGVHILANFLRTPTPPEYTLRRPSWSPR